MGRRCRSRSRDRGRRICQHSGKWSAAVQPAGPADFGLNRLRSQSSRAAAPVAREPYAACRFGAEPRVSYLPGISPKHCLPGAGWHPTESSRISISLPGIAPFEANRYVIAKGDERELVLYWYWAHDRALASEYWAKFYL